MSSPSSSKRTRKSIGSESFYTNPEVALRLVSDLHDEISLRKFKLFLDPAAGPHDTFCKAVQEILPKSQCISFDINGKTNNNNTSTKVIRADFLKLRKHHNKRLNRFDPDEVLVIGNVPFGRRGELAARFLNEAAKYANHIAIIVPMNFVKNSTLDKAGVDKFLHIRWKRLLRGCTFEDANGTTAPSKTKERKVNCAYIYFEKTNNLRQKQKKDLIGSNPFWEYVHNGNPKLRRTADLRIRGSGSKAGTCFRVKCDDDVVLDAERSDEWYVKLNYGTRKYAKQICKEISEHRFSFFNTVPNVKYLNRDQLTKALNLITTLVRLGIHQ